MGKNGVKEDRKRSERGAERNIEMEERESKNSNLKGQRERQSKCQRVKKNVQRIVVKDVCTL